eukprot:SAG11_NODE_39165_length_239_cov_21.300000_1_plen_71_part_01
MARSDQFAATRRPMLGAVGRLSIKISDLNLLRTYYYVILQIRSIKILFLDLYVHWGTGTYRNIPIISSFSQ